jgi:glycosyltransferase involved in cell wall biosynthesis
MQDFISEASFWVPKRFAVSAWTEHAPFAFWLIDVHRPRTLVELGTHYGFSYFVFNQALKRLDTKSHTFAVDTWKGDEHSGFYGEELFAAVRDYNDRQYGDFSELVRATFDDARADFRDGTIDLLHIDGRHFYDDVKHDFETWLPKLSERAVVLLHDTNVRIKDFGVYHLWDELTRQYPHFEFLQGHGLGVLGIGTALPDRLKALFAAAGDESATRQIRAAYTRLGGALIDRMVVKGLGSDGTNSEPPELAHLRAELSRVYQEEGTLELGRVTLEHDYRKLEQRNGDIEQHSQELEHHITQLEAHYQESQAQYTQLEAHYQESQAQYKQLESDHAGVVHKLRELESEQHRVHQENNRLQGERDELVKQVHRSDSELQNSKAGILRGVTERADLQAKLSQTAAERERLKSELALQATRSAAIIGSASWRLTASLRWATQKARSGKRKLRLLVRASFWLVTFQFRNLLRLRAEKRFLLESGLFDWDFYLKQNPDVSRARIDPPEHYLLGGAAAGLDPNPIFDTDWYLARNPDVASQSVNPLLHYLTAGWKEGRNPGPLFDIAFYLEQNKDVAKAEIEPLGHYLRLGGFEGRDPHPLFDSDWYLAQNADVAAAGQNPLVHYASRGWKESRNPHPLFDTSFYLAENSDVAQAGINALEHYLHSGAFDGRDPHPLFKTSWYLKRYPDVAETRANPLIHYLQNGWKEGRSPCAFFDGSFYLARYPEVAQGKVSALEHYLALGATEGRNPSQTFDTHWYVTQNGDVAASGLNPLAHYVHYGLREGRPTEPNVRAIAKNAFLTQGKPRVIFISGEAHTPGHQYRVVNIANSLAPRSFDAVIIKSSELASRLDEMLYADIVWIWRAPWSENIAAVFEAAKRNGAKIIFDVDDLMFRPELGVTEVIDGIRSMALAETDVQKLYSMIRATLELCDHCTVPTVSLAREVRDVWMAASVIPNGFDRSTFECARSAWQNRRSESGDGMVRIGYATGSRTHQRDLALAVPALVEVLSENSSARLVLFRRAVELEEFPELKRLEHQIEWRDLVPVEKLPFEYARFDINLAPLEVGNRFCEAKSELKFFEAALVGVPTIASPTQPFVDAIRHGETGFLANGDHEWHEYLDQLIKNRELRERMAAKAYYEVLWFYGPERRSLLVNRFVNRLLAPSSVSSDLFFLKIERDRLVPLPEIPTVDYDVLYQSERRGISRVSVVIPVFNYAQYLEDALESVRKQTVHDIDIIVIDDQSTDNSVAIARQWLKRYASAFNRVALLQNRRNSQLGASRNVGVGFCDTELFFPLDPDNLLLPPCIEKCLALLDETGAAYVYPTIEVFGNRTEQMGLLSYDPAYFQCGNYIDAMAMVRKAAWIAVGGYGALDPPGYEDYDFWCKLAEKGMYGVRLPEIVARYRAHGHSMLHNITDLPEKKKQVLRDMVSRHPWLSLRPPNAVQPGLVPESPSQTFLEMPIPLSANKQRVSTVHSKSSDTLKSGKG